MCSCDKVCKSQWQQICRQVRQEECKRSLARMLPRHTAIPKGQFLGLQLECTDYENPRNHSTHTYTMVFFKLLLGILAFALLLHVAHSQDVSVQTTYIFKGSQCSTDQE